MPPWAVPLQFTTSYLQDVRTIFRYYKTLAERAMAQVTDEQLTAVLDSEMNSIAIIVKHLAGNLRSRWTDFLAADGEKPGRNRDSEFVEPPPTRAELLALWEQGWSCVFATLDSLSEQDLSRRITIRGEAHSAMQAIHRSLTHCAYHAGQIVFLAKHFAAAGWQSLSVPRGQSAEFNRRVLSGEISQR